MTDKANITPEWVNWEDYFRYESSGNLIWKERPISVWQDKTWNTRNAGKIAGSISNKGYVRIKFSSIANTKVSAHRIVWEMHYGRIIDPLLQIDHINGDRADNRIENLRLISGQANCFNTKAKGYTWHQNNKKWQAQICINQKNKNLGYFETEEEARQAYLSAKEQIHGKEYIRTITED